jgi:Cu(I)/Ag(I) efflux system periplasmic protein CusF
MMALALASTLTAAATAQQQPNEHAAHHSAAAASAVDLTEGEIRQVDKDAKKLTIKHGEIKNLDMPPMTMVFQVQDSALLEGIKAGDKVRFKAQKVGGAYTVTAIEPVK